MCATCIVTDIIQGPNNVLYYTSNDPILGRITTSGEILDPIEIPNSYVVAGDLAVDGNDIWFTDFNNDSLGRYNVVSGQFTQFSVPEPSDAVVDADGFVWFTAPLEQAIGRLDPATGAVTLTRTDTLIPRQLTIAADWDIWFTPRASRRRGSGDRSRRPGAVTEFPLTNVSAWRASRRRPTARSGSPRPPRATSPGSRTPGVITEGKVVKNSEPFGITVASNGNPWYTMMSANKIGTLQLRYNGEEPGYAHAPALTLIHPSAQKMVFCELRLTAFSEVRKGTRAYLIALGSRPHTPVASSRAQARVRARPSGRKRPTRSQTRWPRRLRSSWPAPSQHRPPRTRLS